MRLLEDAVARVVAMVAREEQEEGRIGVAVPRLSTAGPVVGKRDEEAAATPFPDRVAEVFAGT
jgi:hypothetical protein